MHLCNYAVQKVHSKAISSSSDSSDSSDKITHGYISEYMMSINEFEAFLKESRNANYHDVIKPQIIRQSIDAIKSTVDRIERVGKGFEWLGLDFMVTDNLDVFLLEVNVRSK
jgi:hypothetical protein